MSLNFGKRVKCNKKLEINFYALWKSKKKKVFISLSKDKMKERIKEFGYERF